ncbi:ABC transporter ATP-binding protein [Temperatibacter marinus]|uniref:ABC transporter ATP-binding protein n=1 Tax=Temperatibacter marinus TaxID=1456591 RepID=A0AA52EGK3_9PROT|nr:ABC transporter ATP-binding protein [Temperatibacter marinus]WND02395.1 ABC transporter ATP-binding protein [Temperatibacter marinus]
MTSILELKAIHKSFTQAGKTLEILKAIDLSLASGTVTALVGHSGAGKSTLLQIAGLLDQADGGKIMLSGHEIQQESKENLADIRATELGFVYQFHHLLPDFTALENVMMPLLIQNKATKTAREKAADMLQKVGLGERLDHRPAQLSGGEQQRVAIARALVHEPKLLLADEPTGNLDEDTSERVLEALLEIVQKTGVAALIATHDRAMAKKMTTTVELSHGKLQLL